MSDSQPQNSSGPIEGFTYEKAIKVRSIGQYVCAGLLVLAAILKFIHAVGEDLSLRVIVACLFFIALAALIVLEERQNEIVRQYFLLLSYGQARGAIYLCMIVLVLSNAKVNWVDYLIVITFFGFSALNIFITFKFKEEEQ